MDYRKFLSYIEDELEFMEGIDVATDEIVLKGAAGLVMLRDYVVWQMTQHPEEYPEYSNGCEKV